MGDNSVPHPLTWGHMSHKPETRLVSQIMATLRSKGGWWIKIHGSPWQASGIPDIIGCFNGRFIAIEVKMPGSKPTHRQALIIDRINQSGGIAIVAYNVEQVIGMIALASITERS